VSTEATKTKSTVPEIINFRPGELAPLIERWMERNPEVPTTALIKRALRKELAPLAGKRLAHLVKTVAA
jgi:hypothetical protein